MKVLSLSLVLFLSGGLAGYAVTIGGDKGLCLVIIGVIMGGIVATNIMWR